MKKESGSWSTPWVSCRPSYKMRRGRSKNWRSKTNCWLKSGKPRPSNKVTWFSLHRTLLSSTAHSSFYESHKDQSVIHHLSIRSYKRKVTLISKLVYSKNQNKTFHVLNRFLQTHHPAKLQVKNQHSHFKSWVDWKNSFRTYRWICTPTTNWRTKKWRYPLKQMYRAPNNQDIQTFNQ